MSYWVQVAGTVRVDAFRTEENHERLREEIAAYFGKERRWGDPEETLQDYADHPDAYLPCGSEGSLRMYINETPNLAYMDSYAVTFVGSLRDRSSAQPIIDWFKDKIAGLNADDCSFAVRQAVIDVDGLDHVTWRYEADE